MDINRALVTVFLFSIAASDIAGGEWTRLGPEGGMATALAIHPTDPSLVFAATVDGVYLSRDSGNSWERSSSGLTHLRITSIVIAPSSPNRLYAGSEGGGVFRSGDGTASWQAVNQGLEGLFITALAVDPLNPSIVYCSNLDLQIYKSLNGGEEWMMVDDRSDEAAGHGPVRHLAVAPSDPLRLYAGSSFRILKSSDGGLSWDRADEGIDFGTHPSSPLAIHPANPDIVFAGTGSGLFRTTDGHTWEEVTLLEASDLPFDTSEPVEFIIPIDAAAISPSAPDTVYATASSLVFKSEDGGLSWSNTFLIPTPLFGRSTDLAVDPDDPNTLFIGNQSGLFRSRDGGLGWTKLEKGLGSTAVQSLAFDPANPLALYCGTSLGVIKSADGGLSWSGPPFTDGLISEIFLNGNQQGFHDLHIDPLNPRRILAAGGRLMGSRNGGRDWSTIRGESSHDILQDPSDAQILYLATTSQSRAVYKSVDGGLSWTGKDEGLPRPLPSRFPPPVSALSLAVDPSDSSILWAGTPSGIYKSFDAAESWQFMAQGIPEGIPNPRPVPLPIPFPPAGPGPSVPSIVIDPADPSTIYAAVESGPVRESDRRGSVFKSEDGGISWQEAAQGLPGSGVTSLAINPASPRTLYAATWGEGVFRSLDGGLTWEPCSMGLGNPFVWKVLFHPHDPARLYAGTEGGLFEFQEPPTPPARPPVEVVQQVSGNLFAGGTAILEISIANRGESAIPDSEGDEFIEALPFGLMLAAATADGGSVVLGPASDTVTWNGEIAAGQSVGIRIQARVEGTANGRTLSCQGVALLDADGDGIKESHIPSDDPATARPDDPNTLHIEPDVLRTGVLAVPQSLGIEGSFVGLAAFNPGGSPRGLSVEALDGQGKLLSSLDRGQLAILGQDAFLAREASVEGEALLVESPEGPIEGFFMMGDNDLSRLDGIGGQLEDGQQLYFSEIRSSASSRTAVFLFNADTLSSSQVTMTLFEPDGSPVGESFFSLAPFGSLTADAGEIFPGLSGLEDGFARVEATRPVRGFALISDSETFSALAARPARAVERLFSPHFFVEGDGGTLLRVLNPHDRPLGLTVRVFDDTEGLIAEPRFEVPARQLMILDSSMLIGAGSATRQGHLEVLSDGGSAGPFQLEAYPVASVVFEGANPATRSTLPLLERAETEVAFLQVAHSQELGIFQGLAILAPQGTGVSLLSIGSSGEFEAFKSIILRSNQRVAGLLDDPLFFGEGFSQTGGILLVASSEPVYVYSLFGGARFLSALEGRPR